LYYFLNENVMNTEQIQYVRTQREKGVSDNVIKDTLLDNGYSSEQIASLLQGSRNTISAVSEAGQVSLSGAIPMPSIGNYVIDCFRAAAQRLDLIIIAALTFTVLNFLSGNIMNMAVENQIIAILIMGVIPLLFSVTSIVVMFVTLYVLLQEESTSFLSGLKWLVSNFLSLLWILIVGVAVIISGSLFFIIPGLMLIFYTLLDYSVYMKENLRGLDALVRSTQLVHGSFWAVVFRQVVLGIIISLLSFSVMLSNLVFFGDTNISPIIFIVVGLVTGFVAVLGATGIANLYKVLSSQKPEFETVEIPKIPKIYKVMAWIGVFSLPLIMVVGIVAGVLEEEYNDARSAALNTSNNSVLSFSKNMAEIYFYENDSYENVCTEITPLLADAHSSDDIWCTDSAEEYRVVTAVGDGYRCFNQDDDVVLSTQPQTNTYTCR